MSERRERLKERVDEICAAAKERIDDPKNLKKGDDWIEDGEDWLRERQGEEEAEFTEAIEVLNPRNHMARATARDEAGDQVAFLAMRLDCWEGS